MGLTSSTQQSPEGEHYNLLINPSKAKDAAIKPTRINPRARILKKIPSEILWTNFVSGSAASFALTQAEATALIVDSVTQYAADNKIDIKVLESEVKAYITLVEELSAGDLSKTIDFMSLLSSVLLLSDLTIEVKTDLLFDWIALEPGSSDFTFEGFFIAMKSFERGLSHAMGQAPCTENFIRTVATQWMALAEPQHKGSVDQNTRVSNEHFFLFCTNRQHVVRRLLEALAACPLQEEAEKSGEKEVCDTVASVFQKGPAGGDEWMANPAWKKTAERMVPAHLKAAPSVKPASTLELEWVHGYRGFDCRNNLSYANRSGTQVAFTAAALGIVQDNTVPQARTQHYYGEHGDDVLCLASFAMPNGTTLLATGEIGKKPAIYLYVWSPASDGGTGGVFTPLCCMSGYHTKGVTQLAFSPDGKLLFSVGVEYTVAVYCTEQGGKAFGKMVTSGQGPKNSKVMHCAGYGAAAGATAAFITCGEKHAVTWQLEKGSLKQTECKLGAYRNNVILSAAAVVGGISVLGTAEGDLVAVAADKTCAAALKGSAGHGKSAINAMFATPGGEVLVTGDRSGKVVVWQVEPVTVKEGATVTLTACAEFTISGFNTSIAIEGVLNVAAASGQGKGAADAPAAGAGKGKASKGRPASAPTKKAPAGKAAGAAHAAGVGAAEADFDDGSSGGTVPAVRAVTLSADLRRLLVGTQTCEVLEYVLPGGASFATLDAAVSCARVVATQVVCGHFKDEVWGLAVRPVPAEEAGTAEREYCTVGDDGYLRVWSLQQHRQLACVALPGMARACDYSPDGCYLAVGFGGRVGKKSTGGVDGQVKIFRFDRPAAGKSGPFSLMQVGELKDAKQWISCVRFSPDGCTLAVGSRDNSVYLYSVLQQYERKGKFSKHNSGINQLDFTLDGKYLQSNCSAYEILFSDANTGAQVPDGATKLLDAAWQSWTCTLGWPVIGIWSGTMDGTDVNAVHRSHSGRLLASADDFGKVNVFRYPAVKEGGSEHVTYSGHSSHVTSVRWVSLGKDHSGTATDDYLISIGGEDKCVFQWRNSDGAADARSTGASSAGSKHAPPLSPSSVRVLSDDEGEFAPPSGGDEFTAVKPWLGAIVAPSNWSSPDPTKVDPFYAALGEMSAQHRRLPDEGVTPEGAKGAAPEVAAVYNDLTRTAANVLKKLYDSGVSNSTAPDSDELQLEWVHGYRGFDCRNNVFYIESKRATTAVAGGVLPRTVAYFAAALGILQDPVTRTQRYFRGHTDDIVSMAVHKGGSCEDTADAIIATGQQGVGATYVWEVPSMRTLSVLKTKQKNVHLLEFSKDGRKLISISEDLQVAVSDWKSSTVLAITKGDAGATLHLAAGPSAGNLTFLTVGDKNIRLWTLNGRNLTAGKVVTSTCTGAKIQLHLCAAEVAGKYLVGCDDGTVYVVPSEGKGVKSFFEHHTSETKAKLPKNGASITAIHVQDAPEGSKASCLLFTGAKNGTVVVWDASDFASKDRPTKRYTIDISTLGIDGLSAKQIQAISMYTSASYLAQQTERPLLLIATRGCDVVEVCCDLENASAALYKAASSSGKGGGKDRSHGVLVQAHCNDELWGVATHPSKPEYCTVGDDKTLRFYSLHHRRVVATVALGTLARTVCYNHDGSLLAVGFGGRVGKGKEKGGGMLRLYSTDPYAPGGVTKLAEVCDAKEWISDVKFSSDGRTLAVGAHDCKIYLYTVDASGAAATLKLRSTFAKHNSVINHLDMSADGRFMQSNCSAYELLFCDTTTGRQITSATELRDVKWATWTCTLGWPVQGIWSPGMDGSDINAVARSHSGHLVATSDDLGRVNLFRYPCAAVGAGSVSYAAHSSHVMNVRWTAGDECLLSCGGNDKCLMQWRHTMADAGNASAAEARQVTSAAAEEDFQKTAAVSAASPFDDLEGPGGGDEAGAVKPWLGAIRAPKVPPPINSSAPNATLELSWVHGYTSASAGARNTKISSNLFYNANNFPVYPAAALAVQLLTTSGDARNRGGEEKSDAKSGYKQTYCQGHDDDILCLAISKDRRFIATGQTASKASKGKGSVIVWDALQSRLLCKMDGCHQRAVTSLAFSPDGSQLLSVGQDDSNTHILWEDKGGSWSKAMQLAVCKGDKAPVLFTRWVHPTNPMAAKAEYHFLTGGADGVNFWTLQGSTLTKKQGRFSKKFKSAPLLCAANLQGKDSWRMVVGTASGDLYVYDEREVSDAAEGAHKGPVLCVAEGGDDCSFLVSGGRDHIVKLWNQALQPISVFDASAFSVVDASVASLDVRPVDARSPGILTLLVGTYGGEILEVSSGREGSSTAKKGGDGGPGADSRNLDLSQASTTVLLHSHYSGELWGLAAHPLNPDLFATVGDDSTLRIWSIKRNILLKAQPLHWPARSVAWHPSGAALAVGFHEASKGGVKGAKAKKGAAPAAAPGKGAKSTVPKNAAKRGAAAVEEGEDGGGDNIYESGGAAAGSADTAHKGAIHIYSFAYQPNSGTAELRKRADGCSTLAWVNDLKFSPDGTLLLAGSHDKRLYAFDIPYERREGGDANSRKPATDEAAWGAWASCLNKEKYQFNKHSSAVLHVDFTADGRYFQTNCQAAELLFGYPDTGKQETSATKVADYNCDLGEEDGLQWATQTCKLGWAVQGIWPHGSDTTDINSVDRSGDHKLLATADDFGLVKLFRFPCAQEHAKFLSFEGHSSHVTNVRWTVANQLLSVGGNDKCVFVWNMSEK